MYDKDFNGHVIEEAVQKANYPETKLFSPVLYLNSAIYLISHKTRASRTFIADLIQYVA